MTHSNTGPGLLPAPIANGVLLVCCIVTLCVLCIAGFSPFTPHPRNEVRWLEKQNGLHFGEYATILTEVPLRLEGSPDGSCTVELWMQPGVIADSNTMLAFYMPDNLLQFSIVQFGDDLSLERKPGDRASRAKRTFVYVSHILKQDVPVLITVTAGQEGTTLYVNSEPVATSSTFGLSRRDLAGQIVVGNSPFVNDSWSGNLYGIGVYNQALTPEQVRKNYDRWTQSGQPDELAGKSAAAVFSFAERSGTVVHNRVVTGPDLTIPKSYVVLHPPFFEAFWRPETFDWPFWKDMLLNVCGFVPLGICFSAYFARLMTVRRAMFLAILFGVTLSFSIEATQYFLPTRDSDSRDFINNSLGTLLGALTSLLAIVRRIVAWVGVAPATRQEGFK